MEIVDYHPGAHMARIAIHSGEHLAEEPDALKMSAADLARRRKVPTNVLRSAATLVNDSIERGPVLSDRSAEKDEGWSGYTCDERDRSARARRVSVIFWRASP